LAMSGAQAAPGAAGWVGGLGIHAEDQAIGPSARSMRAPSGRRSDRGTGWVRRWMEESMVRNARRGRWKTPGLSARRPSARRPAGIAIVFRAPRSRTTTPTRPYRRSKKGGFESARRGWRRGDAIGAAPFALTRFYVDGWGAHVSDDGPSRRREADGIVPAPQASPRFCGRRGDADPRLSSTTRTSQQQGPRATSGRGGEQARRALPATIRRATASLQWTRLAADSRLDGAAEATGRSRA